MEVRPWLDEEVACAEAAGLLARPLSFIAIVESAEPVYERGVDTVRDYYTVLMMGVYMFLTVEMPLPT